MIRQTRLREHAETLALLFTDRWNFSHARNILYKGAAASTLYGVKVNWSSIETSLISYKVAAAAAAATAQYSGRSALSLQATISDSCSFWQWKQR